MQPELVTINKKGPKKRREADFFKNGARSTCGKAIFLIVWSAAVIGKLIFLKTDVLQLSAGPFLKKRVPRRLSAGPFFKKQGCRQWLPGIFFKKWATNQNNCPLLFKHQ
jgi:hypothetical protein